MKNKNSYSRFLILWSGQFASSIGSGLTVFSLGIYVFQETQSVASFSLILLSIFFPSLLIKPFGGVLADRFDRRSIMFIGDLGASVGTLFILVMMNLSGSSLWFIYLGIIISSIFGAIQEPAYKASVTDLLSKNQYAKASGLMQLASSSQHLISPFLAGLTLYFLDIKFVFIFDIITFIFAILTIMWVKKALGNKNKISIKQSLFKDLREGLTEFYKHKGIVYLVGVVMSVLFFVGLLQALFVPMLLSLTNIKYVGAIQSFSASGMLLGSLFLGIFGNKRSQVKTLSISLFFAGLFFSLIGVSENIIFIALATFLFFSFLPFVNTSIEVLIRRRITNKKQGRVWSIISTITYLGSMVAFLVAGFLADKIFEPLFKEGGKLFYLIGDIIGVGGGRGIGFMFIISGFLISFIAILIVKNQTIKNLDEI